MENGAINSPKAKCFNSFIAFINNLLKLLKQFVNLLPFKCCREQSWLKLPSWKFNCFVVKWRTSWSNNKIKQQPINQLEKCVIEIIIKFNLFRFYNISKKSSAKNNSKKQFASSNKFFRDATKTLMIYKPVPFLKTHLHSTKRLQ